MDLAEQSASGQSPPSSSSLAGTSSPATTLLDVGEEDYEYDEDDLLPPDAAGICRIRKRPGDKKIRPAYYWPSGTTSRGVPCFEPTEAEFSDFNAFVEQISHYGMTAGIVKVKPPASWLASLPSVSEQLSEVRLRDPISQNFIGSSGLYRVANVAKSRIWNAKQWKELADSDTFATPDFFKQNVKPTSRKRKASTLARGQMASAATSLPQDAMAAGSAIMEITAVAGPSLDASDQSDKGAARKPTKAAARKKHGSAMCKADVSAREWSQWEGQWDQLPHGSKPEDYTVAASHEIERAYWRMLTFGEPPMYGADMKGSLFTAETRDWNVADLRDLLTRLGRYHRIPGVNTPYLYFGMWRATFAWHVEDADLYSINYIHFGAPKIWYSVPQAQAEKFERVMSGWFPQEQGKCRQFLRHKSYLASPKKLANEGVALNKVVQLPGEFILTFPYGYHSGFNVGFNCAESINFANDAWIDIGRKAKPCACVNDSVKIDVDEWLRAAEEGAQTRKRGAYEPWFARPKRQRIEYDDPAVAAKRAAAQAKRAAKAEAARQAAARLPFVCALCPDMTTETLVPLAPPAAGVKLSAEQQAHRRPGAAHKACVMYVPSTYIDVDSQTGEELVFGFEGIEKDRWKLKCQLCDDRHGCPIQCTKSDKCVRAQHITCALREDSGVIVDAFLTDNGFEHSLIAPDETAPLPTKSPQGTVRLVVHCRTHNPEWLRLQANIKATKLAADVARVTTGSRVRARVGGSAFEVVLLFNRPELGCIEAMFEDGKRGTIKYGALVLLPSVTPPRSAYNVAHAVPERSHASDTPAAGAILTAPESGLPQHTMPFNGVQDGPTHAPASASAIQGVSAPAGHHRIG